MVTPTADPELLRLLDAYGQAEYEWGATAHTHAGMHGDLGRRQHATMDDARAALLAHITAHYIPRDAARGYQAARGVVPWRPGDELPEDAIRRLRDGEAGRDPSARATLARLDAVEDKIRARMTPDEYERFCQARAEVLEGDAHAR